MQANKAIKLEMVGEPPLFCSLDGQSRICNWAFNHLLDQANQSKADFIATGQNASAALVYSERGLRNLLPSLKATYPFLKSVHSSPLKNTALRLSSAIRAHQNGKKKKRKTKSGWPRFRSWKSKWFSLLYDEPGKGFKVTDDTLRLSLGQDENGKRSYLSFRLKEAFLLRGHTIRTLRIIKEGTTYYAVFTVSIELPPKKQLKRAIALDPNHKNLAFGVDTDGVSIEIEAPFWLKGYDRRIDELKSKRDRCQKRAKKAPVLDSQGLPTGKEYTIPSRRWQKFQGHWIKPYISVENRQRHLCLPWLTAFVKHTTT